MSTECLASAADSSLPTVGLLSERTAVKCQHQLLCITGLLPLIIYRWSYVIKWNMLHEKRCTLVNYHKFWSQKAAVVLRDVKILITDKDDATCMTNVEYSGISPQGTTVCRYNWHSAGSLGWPFPTLKYKLYLSNQMYGSNFIEQHSETVMVWNY